jgi:hypothetical protein
MNIIRFVKMDLFELLPCELVEVLLDYLRYQDIKNFYDNCSQINIYLQDKNIWRRLFEKTFGKFNKILDIDCSGSIKYVTKSYFRACEALHMTDYYISECNRISRENNRGPVILYLDNMNINKLLFYGIIYIDYPYSLQYKIYSMIVLEDGLWKYSTESDGYCDILEDDAKLILLHHVFSSGSSWYDMYKV